LILGCAVSNQSADAPHLAPMVAQVQATTGGTPKAWSADAGFFSAPNVAVLEAAGIDGFIPPDRQRHSQQPLPAGVARILAAAGLGPPAALEAEVTEAAVKAAMRAKLRTREGQAGYAKRKLSGGPGFRQR